MSKEIRLMIDKIRNFKQINESVIEIKSLLTEASKIEVLVQKEGLDANQAKILDEICGPLSLWIFSKIKDLAKEELSKERGEPKNVVEYINSKNTIEEYRETIQGIMDWIRMGLNGNIKPFKDLTFEEISNKSKEWHDSLTSGKRAILNYDEKNPIFLDFKDKNGYGFYWADLQTKSSREECERMGHCGTSQKGYLYSLRQNMPFKGEVLNVVHLTASVGKDDGILYQLKGPRNKKPTNEYHKYILPLFNKTLGGDEYFIRGFGTEYASQEDFNFSDLPVQLVLDLYKKRPDLFNFVEKGIESFSEHELNLLALPELKDLRNSLRNQLTSSLEALKGDSITIKFPDSGIAKILKLYPDFNVFDVIPSNVYSLSLIGDGTFEIDVPESINKFTSIDTLVFRNVIKSLPKSIGDLNSLQYVIISDNKKLTSLPESLLKLKKNNPDLFFDIENLPNLDEKSQKIKDAIS